MDNIHSIDEVEELFTLNVLFSTPDAECFDGLTIMVLESDKIDQDEKRSLERSIRLSGGVTTND
jgi:hypothetical protein